MGPVEPYGQVQIYFCAICNGPGTTRHHLIPRSTRNGNRDTILLCRDCHADVHWFFSNWELALKFNTEELLKTELAKRKEWKLPGQTERAAALPDRGRSDSQRS
jgi:hypothetical protein